MGCRDGANGKQICSRSFGELNPSRRLARDVGDLSLRFTYDGYTRALLSPQREKK